MQEATEVAPRLPVEMPTGHKSQLDAPAIAAYEPAAQAAHIAEPFAAKCPGAQLTQELADTAPNAADDVPLGHCSHVVKVLGMCWKVPPGHTSHVAVGGTVKKAACGSHAHCWQPVHQQKLVNGAQNCKMPQPG